MFASLHPCRRQQAWAGIVRCCTVLRVIAAEVEQQRQCVPVMEQRKAAAVKIATWYKGCLLRRRHKELIELAMKVWRKECRLLGGEMGEGETG